MQLLDLAGSHHVGSPGSVGSSVPADGSMSQSFPEPGEIQHLETLRQRNDLWHRKDSETQLDLDRFIVILTPGVEGT
jgi:hypothetical protein